MPESKINVGDRIQLAQSVENVFEKIEELNESLSTLSKADLAKLRKSITSVKSFYVYEEENGETLFGFSKFIGYNLPLNRYLESEEKKKHDLGGNETEPHFKKMKWFTSLEPETQRYRDLYAKLVKWLVDEFNFELKPNNELKKPIKINVKSVNSQHAVLKREKKKNHTQIQKNSEDLPLPPPPFNLIFFGPPGTGKTYRLRKYQQKYIEKHGEDRYEFITFHQNYSYEDFIEGIRPKINQDGHLEYQVRPGVLKHLCDRAKQAPDQRFALFIDEINRGNISKIFGEIITLIEADKRIEISYGARKPDVGMVVKLPISDEKFDGHGNPVLEFGMKNNEFGISKNIDIYGTMNTADRSIALFDLALRRRFKFEELRPDPTLLKKISLKDNQGKLIHLDLEAMLRSMNERIEYLLDRDHVIGHSYFQFINTFDELRDVFAYNIFPLLEEMFYGNYEQMRYILADGTVSTGNENLQLVRRLEKPTHIGGFDDSKIPDIESYRVVSRNDITIESIQKIYKKTQNPT